MSLICTCMREVLLFQLDTSTLSVYSLTLRAASSSLRFLRSSSCSLRGMYLALSVKLLLPDVLAMGWLLSSSSVSSRELDGEPAYRNQIRGNDTAKVNWSNVDGLDAASNPGIRRCCCQSLYAVQCSLHAKVQVWQVCRKAKYYSWYSW